VKIDIICVGKLKEEYLRAAEREYTKRLTPYVRLSLYELAEDTLPKEAAKITKLLDANPSAYKIALAIGGKTMPSVDFAEKLETLAVNSIPHIAFVIGGSDGLTDEVLRVCHMQLSLSAMTFTHQIARILLLEQIYRAYKIINNEPYHK